MTSRVSLQEPLHITFQLQHLVRLLTSAVSLWKIWRHNNNNTTNQNMLSDTGILVHLASTLDSVSPNLFTLHVEQHIVTRQREPSLGAWFAEIRANTQLRVPGTVTQAALEEQYGKFTLTLASNRTTGIYMAPSTMLQDVLRPCEVVVMTIQLPLEHLNLVGLVTNTLAPRCSQPDMILAEAERVAEVTAALEYLVACRYVRRYWMKPAPQGAQTQCQDLVCSYLRKVVLAVEQWRWVTCCEAVSVLGTEWNTSEVW